MLRVLIIDDEAAMREVVITMLTRSGFDVEAAESSEQAIQLYNERPPFDVILTDPTGLEFAHFVKNRNPSQPMGFMSATWNVVEAQRSQFTFALMKPFDQEELLGKIQDAVKGKPKQAH